MSYNKRDQDQSKGATEDTDHRDPGNAGMEGQLGHRDQDSRIKGSDSDFPEPGGNPEHSGQPEEPARRTRSAP